MVLNDVASRERRIIAAVLVAAVAVSFTAGYAGATMTASPTGAAMGDAASTDDIRQNVQSLMDQQVAQQEQQFASLAAQSENISEDDISMDATVADVSGSDFPGLYEVTVSIEGQVPGQTGGLESMDQEQALYISEDGRYLFQEPTDLEQLGQQAPAPTP